MHYSSPILLQVFTFHVFEGVGAMSVVVLISFVLYVLLFLYLVVNELLELRRKGGKYFR